ncbi:MAG: FAD-binding oxidoreductase [Oceanospirillaceae bacterium]|nr:FAD-binding oxidoreductase [Oceanospirillaceae bacterium]
MQYNIDSLPHNDQTCGWINNLPSRGSFPVLAGKHLADWVVIGGGYTGIAFARRMAEANPNHKIIILDAGAIGEGASSRNSGFAVATSSSGEAYNPAKLAEFKRINRINNAGIESLRQIVTAQQIDCQWRDVGKFHCGAPSTSAKAADDFIHWLEAAQIPHEDLSQAQLSKRLGTAYYRRGVWTKADVMLQPAALIRGLSDSLPENVTLHDYSAALSVEDKKGLIHIGTAKGEVIAKNMVLASNAFLHTMTPSPSYTVPLTMTASLTRPLTKEEQTLLGDVQDWGILSLHGMGATIRYTADHRILIRNTAAYNAVTPLRSSQMLAAQQTHLLCLRQRFPMLEELNFEHSWQGVLCISRNSSSLFGKLADNIYVSGCYNASGISRGSAMGLALADYALGDNNQLLSDALAYPAPTWMPPRPILDIAMKAEIMRRKYGTGPDA